MFRRNQIRSRFISQFNHCTLDNLPNSTIFQCNRCRKYNTIFNQERNMVYQNCLFCGQPNYVLQKVGKNDDIQKLCKK